MLKTTFNIKATSNWVKFSIKNEKNKVLYKIKNCPVAIIASDKYKENAVRIGQRLLSLKFIHIITFRYNKPE